MLLLGLSSMLVLVGALADTPIPLHTQAACVSFAQDSLAKAINVTWLGAIYHGAHSVNVSNAFNEFGFCEVNASVMYGCNDSLHFSVWLPDTLQYNERFMAVGNGGMAGVIDYSNMMTQLNAGFAVAGGDAGHRAAENNDGQGAPNTYIPYLHDSAQVNAWIHNAISSFTPTAKSLVKDYYGKPARYNYYDGCSTGGAQGFALAQFHPELFDGIIAGSPGNWYSHLALSFLWNAQHTSTNTSYLPQSTLDAITSAVLDACDALDGVTDRLLENPLRCTFDIASLLCNSTSVNSTSCLSEDQLSAARSIYAGPSSSEAGQIYPGFSLGSETEWLLQEGTLSKAFAEPILQNLVYDNLTYNTDLFNWTTGISDVDERAGAYIDETSVNLTAFKARGGKLLVTQGWAGPFNAATWPIQHMADLETFYGGDISSFFNLFMIPGGGHCGAASNYPSVPAVYHTVPRLTAWVERGEVPKEILSTAPPDGSVRSRKLCPWPQTAVYVQGDVDDWVSYVCE